MRMMECLSHTWGGDGNGLVACSPTWEMSEPFWILLKAFDADHWAVFQRTLRGLQMADPAAYEAVLARYVADWIAANSGTEAQARQDIEAGRMLSAPRAPLPTVFDRRLRHWFAPMASEHVAVHASFSADEHPPSGLVDMCQLTYRPNRVNTFDVARWPASIQLLVAARTGNLSPRHRALLEEGGTTTESLATTADELSLLLEFAWTGTVDTLRLRLRDLLGGTHGESSVPGFMSADVLADSPLVQTQLGCRWFKRWRPGSDESPAVVVCGDTAEDFCYAFTRRRLMGDTYWLPTRPGALDVVGRTLRETLVKVLSTNADSPRGNREILVSSLTLSTADLATVVTELQATVWGRDLTSGVAGRLTVRVCEADELPVSSICALLDEEHFDDIDHEPFLGPEMARNLHIALPSRVQGKRPESLRWQVDLIVPDHILPARWCLNSVITAGDSQNQWRIRSSTSGISVDSHGRVYVAAGSSLSQMLVQVRLRYPPASEVFGSLLLGVNGSIEESDKGRFTRRMIELWGDLNALSMDLRATSTSQLLAAWITDAVAGDFGRVHQKRKYLRLEDAAAISGIEVNETRQLLDRYLSRAIVARGLLLRCERCAFTSFYRVEDLGQGFRCQRCRQENLITQASWRDTPEPRWFYALDEVVYQALDSDIRVPVLALAEIARSAGSFLYMPEAIVRIAGRPEMEVDLWAIVDGQIVIGEAKRSDELCTTARREERRCVALRALGADLSADQFVMATESAQWKDRTRTNVNQLINPTVPVRWLTAIGAQAD